VRDRVVVLGIEPQWDSTHPIEHRDHLSLPHGEILVPAVHTRPGSMIYCMRYVSVIVGYRLSTGLIRDGSLILKCVDSRAAPPRSLVIRSLLWR
jgi:hypothetical protein